MAFRMNSGRFLGTTVPAQGFSSSSAIAAPPRQACKEVANRLPTEVGFRMLVACLLEGGPPVSDLHTLTDDLVKASLAKVKSESPPVPEKITNVSSAVDWYAMQVRRMTESIDDVERSLDAKSSCSKGCTHCCNQAILITVIEAAAITGHLKTKSHDERKTVQKKVDEACEAILSTVGEPSSDDRATLDAHRKRYFASHIPCPLLAPDGSCGVYSVRPTNCWTYRAYGDPLWCQASPDVEGTVTYADREQVLIHSMGPMLRRIPSSWRSVQPLRLLPFALKEFWAKASPL